MTQVLAGAKGQDNWLGARAGGAVFSMGCCWGQATERQAAPRAWRPLPGWEDSSRGQIPHGLQAEVPVASVSLPVKWEQGFPEVLLAFSVRCLLCFLCGGWSLPK